MEDIITLAKTVNTGEKYSGKYFIQTADLDLSSVNWEPIGYTDSDYYFSGNYNGDNHTISNISSIGKSDTYGQSTVGIFGCITGGSVSNLHVRKAEFKATGNKAYGHAGGLIGIALGAKVTNCSVTDSNIISNRIPNNNNCAGGIAGYVAGTNFSKCVSASNKITSQAYAGGFAGENDDDDDYGVGKSSYADCFVADCQVYSSVNDVQGLSITGGFIGEMTATDLTLKNCYVYNTTLSTDGTTAYSKCDGIFAGNLWGGSKIIASNCYYGECSVTDTDKKSR